MKKKKPLTRHSPVTFRRFRFEIAKKKSQGKGKRKDNAVMIVTKTLVIHL